MLRQRRRPVADDLREVGDTEKSRRRTLDRAVRLLAAKPRSVNELRDRLLEKPWTNAEIVDAVIKQLAEYRYVDDEQFARDLALSKLRQRPQGRRRLEASMSQKKLDRGVMSTAIDEAFDVLPEADLIDVAISRQLRLRGRPEGRDELKKFIDHLLRRGFSYDLIRQKLPTITREPVDDEN